MNHISPGTMDPKEDEDEKASSIEFSALFSLKRKPAKKTKITLNTKEEDEEVSTAEIIKKTLTNEEIPKTSKLDYSYGERNEHIKSASNLTATKTAKPDEHAEYDTEFYRDHLTRRKEALERSLGLAAKGELDTKYLGLKGYQQFLMQGDTAKASAGSDKNRVAGPVRAAANLRVTCRFDYKPDLCKDYNETGFCGFGDSCIFLHDRTEHKSSYQLEQEWDAELKRKQLDLDNSESIVKDVVAQSKPTTCTVCSNYFTRPVKTKCSHYFCEGCVLRLQKCPICKTALQGSFKPASKELQLQ